VVELNIEERKKKQESKKERKKRGIKGLRRW